ncbi:hypothetical protein JJV70_11190 [Streptomyces sp. JJ66]|uniref:hypothetical protein n=1 Tax=Streptomyces sp. JJ66 TaxID=2803843 RepID=UPI001C59A5FA|nr:hypothetical protein [Streptomyces sp. JJ66]MBW1602662.1 hypothetical protein [Streptomyces sp. JJ66]
MTDVPEDVFHVGVHVSGCSREAAGTVFGALESAFPTGLLPAGRQVMTEGADGGGHMVWSVEVDTRRGGSGTVSAPAALPEPVVVDLDGPAHPVGLVKKVLTAAFDTEDHGTAPGEHEIEVRLRLL